MGSSNVPARGTSFNGCYRDPDGRVRSAGSFKSRLLVPLVAERLSSRRRRPDPRATAIAGSALACLDAAQEAWTDDPKSSLGALLDDAMAAVAPLE